MLYIGRQSEKLLPKDRIERARAIAWLFAALNSVEIWIQQLGGLHYFHAEEDWADQRRPQLEKMVQDCLGLLEAALGDKKYLEGRFTVGDLMMSDVLRIIDFSDIVDAFPRLSAYKQRCEARPAFKRAMQAQIDGFKKAA